MFEELNGRTANERVNLRDLLATTAYAEEAVASMRTMVAQTTVLALCRMLDEPEADILGLATIRTALSTIEFKKATENSAKEKAGNFKCGPGATSIHAGLVKRLRRLPKITKRLKPLRNHSLAHSIDKPFDQLKIRNIRLCLIYCIKVSRDANLLIRGVQACYPVYIAQKRREAGCFWDCFEDGLAYKKEPKFKSVT
jgi:hypothetical protein